MPRIHGFELLMASYAMCHMRLDMILTGLGYKPSPRPPRLGVYLTNSLEEGERVEQTLFRFLQRAIAEEAKAASDIKRQTPIMCVIGNPPYSGESENKGPWIMNLMEAYKKEPGGQQKLQERNPKWINDDYVKFIHIAKLGSEIGIRSQFNPQDVLLLARFRLAPAKHRFMLKACGSKGQASACERA